MSTETFGEFFEQRIYFFLLEVFVLIVPIFVLSASPLYQISLFVQVHLQFPLLKISLKGIVNNGELLSVFPRVRFLEHFILRLYLSSSAFHSLVLLLETFFLGSFFLDCTISQYSDHKIPEMITLGQHLMNLQQQ